MEEWVEDTGRALLTGGGGSACCCCSLQAAGPAPLLAPQRRVVRGVEGEQVMLEP